MSADLLALRWERIRRGLGDLPPKYDDLAGMFDPGQPGTITSPGSNRVQTWASKVGGYSITDGGVSGAQPLWELAPTGFNGLPAVYSDGTRLLSTPSTVAYGDKITMHMVLRNAITTAGAIVLEHGNISTS